MNEHIKKTCYDYIGLGINPEYGLLINGPWGCGKTYLVDEMKKKLPVTINKDDIIIISMYGVTKVEDIGDKIFEKTNTILSNEKFKTAANVVSSVSFVGVSFDAKIVTQLLIKDWFKEKNRVVIVDDIERAKLPVTEIFGYFYNLILDKNVRVIFIGHDENVNCKNYKETKEKVIGKTLTIKPDIEAAINAFVEYDLTLGISKVRAKEIVMQVISNLGVSNLRAVRLGFLNIGNLMEEVSRHREELMNFEEEDYASDEYTVNQYFEDIFKYYIVIFLQYTQGLIVKENGEDSKLLENEDLNKGDITATIGDVIGLYSNYEKGIIQYYEEKIKKGKGNSQKKDPMSNFTEKLKFSTRNFIPLMTSEKNGYAIWEKYLLESRIDADLIENAVKKDIIHFTPKVKLQKPCLLKMLEGMFDMSKEEFADCYKGMIEELLKGEHQEAGEILHGFALCVYLEEQGVIKNEEETLEQLFDRIIEKTSIQRRDCDYGFGLLDAGSLGYSYLTVMYDERWQLFVKKISDLTKENSSRDLKGEFIEQFENIETNDQWNEWVKELYNNYGNEQRRYRDLPLISYLDVEELFDKAKTKGVREQRKFFEVLKERYGVNYSNGKFEEKYFPDYDNLFKLKNLYEKHLGTLEVGDNSIMKIRKMNILIDELIEYCRNFIDSKEK